MTRVPNVFSISDATLSVLPFHPSALYALFLSLANRNIILNTSAVDGDFSSDLFQNKTNAQTSYLVFGQISRKLYDSWKLHGMPHYLGL